MNHYQVIFSSNADQADWLSDLISEAGALAVSLLDAEDQAIFEPKLGSMPLWQRVEIEALFADENEAQIALEQLQNWLGELPPYRTQWLAERNWVKETQEQFQPQCFANCLWVYPEWIQAPQDHQPIIKIAPGLAFGTGTHPTTQLCLTWLAQNLAPRSKVVDYGCGSGILALAALALGAEEVLAVDNDPQALQASQQNIGHNQIAVEKLLTYLPEDAPQNYQADVVIANILAGPLCELRDTLCHFLKPKGQLVLSGILAEQVDMVQKAYAPMIQLSLFDQQEEWCCLAGNI